MLSIKSWSSIFITKSAYVLFLAPAFAQSPTVPGGQRARAARLAGLVTWGSPDQPYGKRRPVSDGVMPARRTILRATT